MATPSWTDKVSVVTLQKVANGSSARGTLNLNNKFGAYLFVRVARLSSTAPATGMYIRARRYVYDGANSRDVPHPGAIANLQDTTTAANLTTLNNTPGSASVSLLSATGFAANQTVAIVDSTSSPTRCEFHQTSKLSGSTLTLDRNLANASIASGDTITNQALVFPPIWVDGGPNTTIEVVFDYGAEANASPVAVEAWAQTLDSIA